MQMTDNNTAPDTSDGGVARAIWGDQDINDDERIPMWLDCDTGHDDAFAVLLAAQCPRIKLLGISTVHGNASLEHTTRNTLSILEAIGRRDIPVYPGSAKPFCRTAYYAPDIHGDSGLDGTTVLPDPVVEPSVNEIGTIGVMYRALSKYPEKAWLVSTGAVTNIALLFAVYPQLADQIAGFSIMGGVIGGFFTNAPLGKLNTRLTLSGDLYKLFPAALPDDSGMTIAEVAKHFEELGILKGNENLDDERTRLLLEQARLSFGNTTPFAEFNIYCDPEAARSIFSNPVLSSKTTLVPLDLTHQVLGTPEILSMIKYGSAHPTKDGKTSLVRKLFHEIITYFASTYDREFRMPSPPLHDPVAVFAALAPTSFDDNDGERFEIHVVCTGDEENLTDSNRGENVGQCGRTIAKMVKKGNTGVRIPRTLHVPSFWHLIELGLVSAEDSKTKQNRS